MLIDPAHHLGHKRQAVGDMVCLHTGITDALLAIDRQPGLDTLHATGSGLGGWDQRLPNWITDLRLACLVADNPAVELVMSRLDRAQPMRQPQLPLRAHCLFKVSMGRLAEAVGFEPTDEFPRRQFSRLIH